MGIPNHGGRRPVNSTDNLVPLTTERWRRPSVRARTINRLLERTSRRYVRKLTGDLTPELTAGFARIDPMCAAIRAPRATRTESVVIDEFSGEWVHGEGVTSRRDGAILYVHGGGWMFGGLNSHRALISRLSATSGLPALALNYRMHPTVSLVQEVEDCLAGYRWLLDRGVSPDRIVLMGDSAGGHLAVTAALRARSEKLATPAALVGISGVYDLDPGGKREHPNAKRDPAGFMGGLTWLIETVGKGLDTSAAHLSPVRADLQGLPPTLLVVSGSEIVYSDSERLSRELAAAGVPCHLHVWDGQPHVFPMLAPLIPEARLAIAQIGRFVRNAVTSARSRPGSNDLG